MCFNKYYYLLLPNSPRPIRVSDKFLRSTSLYVIPTILDTKFEVEIGITVP